MKRAQSDSGNALSVRQAAIGVTGEMCQSDNGNVLFGSASSHRCNTRTVAATVRKGARGDVCWSDSGTVFYTLATFFANLVLNQDSRGDVLVRQRKYVLYTFSKQL